jgi:hypothetical protein
MMKMFYSPNLFWGFFYRNVPARQPEIERDRVGDRAVICPERLIDVCVSADVNRRFIP